MLQESYKLCRDFHKTYNSYVLNNYPQLKDIFVEVMDVYEKNRSKFPKINKTLISLVHNLINQENIPIVDYITGPGEISKWESKKDNKIIYLFGENDHSNKNNCLLANKKGQVNLSGKKYMSIQNYLLKLFENSPVFIDFYIEFGVMLDYLEPINTTSGQTLWDMLTVMHGCFGPLVNRDCQYNVRMHGVDARSIKSYKHYSSKIAKMSLTIMMQNVLKAKNSEYIPLKIFKIIFKNEIKLMATIKNYKDLIDIIIRDIENNTLIKKELDRSTIPSSKILDFFVKKELTKSLSKYPISIDILIQWFIEINKPDIKSWPLNIELDLVSSLMTMTTAVIMDVYTVARMFKVFSVKNSDFYPKEPQNIIYYAGTGHTRPMGKFLKSLNFQRTEHSNDEILSCVSMKGIKQPLFS